MLYATYVKDGFKNEFSGHVNDSELSVNFENNWRYVTIIQADGDELENCCDILGRPYPSSRVYHFLGDNAKEIAANWHNTNYNNY